MQVRRRSREVVSIQYLRALAATLVVFNHARQFPGFADALDTTVGNAGVDLFFVISGFVMAVTTAEAGYPAGRFLAKRMIRIIPIYWFLTFVTAGALFVAPFLFRDNAFTWPHLLLSLLFVPHASPVGGYSPMIKIGWTLNFEMFFYVVFALFLFLPLTRRILAIAALFAGLIAVSKLLHPHSVPVLFLGDGLLFEFVMGCIVGRLHVCGRLGRIPPPAAGLAILGAAAVLLAMGAVQPAMHRLFRFGLAGAVIVAATVALEENGKVGLSPRLKYLGDASYSLYLTQLSVIVVLRKLWVVAALPTAGLAAAVAFVGISLAGSIAVGTLCYAWIEWPMLAFLRRHLLDPASRRRPAPLRQDIASRRPADS